jgi:IstB-like ATP binding protein
MGSKLAGDATLTAALLGRLLHRSHVINIEGVSVIEQRRGKTKH